MPDISTHPVFAALSAEARTLIAHNERNREDQFHARIAAWLDTLDQRAPEGYRYECDAPRGGQRYVRVVMIDRGGSRSVHAFYDQRTGEVYKAATWKAPAKHVRYSLLDDESFARLIEVADWSGAYLYMK